MTDTETAVAGSAAGTIERDYPANLPAVVEADRIRMQHAAAVQRAEAAADQAARLRAKCESIADAIQDAKRKLEEADYRLRETERTAYETKPVDASAIVAREEARAQIQTRKNEVKQAEDEVQRTTGTLDALDDVLRRTESAAETAKAAAQRIAADVETAETAEREAVEKWRTAHTFQKRIEQAGEDAKAGRAAALARVSRRCRDCAAFIPGTQPEVDLDAGTVSEPKGECHRHPCQCCPAVDPGDFCLDFVPLSVPESA